MFSYLKVPALAILGVVMFSSLLAYQNPLSFSTPSGIHSLSLVEASAGCQKPVERGSLPLIEKLPEPTVLGENELPGTRINSPESEGYFRGLGDIVSEGELVIIYSREIAVQDYQKLEQAVLTVLSEERIPVYLAPHVTGEWDTRGQYEIYSSELIQECVVGDPEVLINFNHYSS